MKTVVKEKCTINSKKSAVELTIGTAKGKYGNPGRGYLRFVDFEKGRDGQISIALEPVEMFALAGYMDYAAKKGEGMAGTSIHKYNDSTTQVWVVVDKKEDKTFYGLRITRAKGDQKNNISVNMDRLRYQYLAYMLKSWTPLATFVEYEIKDEAADGTQAGNGASATNGSGSSASSQGDEMMDLPGDLGDELQDIPF